MKRKLINSFIILSASSAIAKLFSILNRMILARQLSSEAMALYILVMPTVSLCITLGQLGIPSAVFRLVANPKYNNKKIIISAFTICLFTCVIVMSTLLFASKFISHDLLKNEGAFYVCMNQEDSSSPEHLKSKSLYIDGDLSKTLRDLKQIMKGKAGTGK